MNVEIGSEAAQFPVKEYINWIFLAVWVRGNKAALLPLLLTHDMKPEEGGGARSTYGFHSGVSESLMFFLYIFGGIFSIFSYNIHHCFICRPSDSTVPTDAGIEPRTGATGALAVRRSNH
jgi:hypothetical protein